MEATRLLLELGTDLNMTGMDGDKPLHKAVPFGNTKEELVSLLLEYRADVNAPNGNGETPMIIFAKMTYRVENAERLVQLLLNKGADTSATDRVFGRTSLEWSVLQGRETVVKLLLEHDVSEQV